MTTMPALHSFNPDYASPPGQLLQELLERYDISARELARRCGRTPKVFTEIVQGKGPVEPETALQLERVLDVPASLWMALESHYRLHLAREAEASNLSDCAWVDNFPTRTLFERGFISCRTKGPELALELLRFFGAGNFKALKSRIEQLLAADLRTSPAYGNQLESLAAWLRIGEIVAEKMNPPEFDGNAFKQALRNARALTRKPIAEALPLLRDHCARAGVVFVFEPALGKIATSGASCWLSPRRALIQQSGRYRSDDHFWFTFYHECAHLLLHSRKQVFIDVMQGKGSASMAQENEANAWAADFLIPAAAMRRFIRSFEGGEEEILDFAEDIGIAPGIVVGQLQHNGIVGFKDMNHLRQRFELEELQRSPSL